MRNSARFYIVNCTGDIRHIPTGGLTKVPTLGIDDDGLNRLRKYYKGELDTDKLLAQHLDLSVPTVNRVINGKYAPGPKFIAAVCKAFGKRWAVDLFKVIED